MGVAMLCKRVLIPDNNLAVYILLKGAWIIAANNSFEKLTAGRP